MSISAGTISMGAYLPARRISHTQKAELTSYLREATLLPREYVEQIEAQERLPGTIETNEEGWEKRPWFEAWLGSAKAF